MKKYDYSKLKALREERKLTQKDMGNLLGITQGAYNKLETGNRKRKNDSILDIEKMAEAFQLTPERLISILTGQVNIRVSGIKEEDLWEVQKIVKNNPLREDEFVFFTTELLELDKHGFKKDYKRFDSSNMDDLDPFPMWEYPPPVNIIIADSTEIGFRHEQDELKEASIWLGNKKLGVIPEHHVKMVYELIQNLMISRALIIANDDDPIPGYIDTYMKVVFIASNSVCKSSEFKKGRFSSLRLLTEEEVKESDKAEEEDVD